MSEDRESEDPLDIDATLERYRDATAALAEIVARANELHTASERMTSAESTLGSAAQALDANATAIRELATALAAAAGQLGALATSLLALDPKKVRLDLDDLRSAVDSDTRRGVEAERALGDRIAEAERHFDSTSSAQTRTLLRKLRPWLITVTALVVLALAGIGLAVIRG